MLNIDFNNIFPLHIFTDVSLMKTKSIILLKRFNNLVQCVFRIKIMSSMK